MPEKRAFIIHPFILAVYPVLFYYNLNKHEVWFSETLVPMAALLFITFLVFVLLKIIFKEASRAGILTSFILILFFSYEAIQTGMVDSKIGSLILNLDPNLLWSYGILLTLATTALCFWNGRNHKVTEYLNAVSVILIAFPLMGLVDHKISTQGNTLFPATQYDRAIKPDNFNFVGSKPDIYYIIMDGYMRNDVMEEFWGFDNSAFINYLTNHGFYVAPKSRSNYPHTELSLASSLNMEYLPTTLGIATVDKINNIPLIEAIEKNRVINFLKSLGYHYVHLSDDAAGTKKNGEADIVITNRKYISFFSQYLLNKTILKNLNFHSLDAIQIKRNNILHGFKKLKEIPKNDEPTFTFAHFLMPHGPQVFDKSGDIPIQSASDPSKYFGEVLYANKKIRQLVEYILENSDVPPIIIIQGDHGYSFTVSNRPNVDEVKKRYSNLNAYYLPEQGKNKLYKTITPVNSFRLIFDYFFGTQYGLLEDKSYLPVSGNLEGQLILVPSEDYLSNSGLSAWVTSLKQTILNKPDLAEAHALLGRYYILLGRFPEAKESLEKALHFIPNLTWAHISLAMTYSLTKDYSMALDTIQQAIRMNPKIAEAHKILGEIKMATGSYNEAISSFNKAIRISPENTAAISGLGRVYSLLNDKKRSLLYFKKLVLISPSFDSYNDLGSTYAQFGLNKEAILNFKKVLEINPRSATAYYNLGNIYIKRKDYEEGINFYQKAVEQKPDYLEAYYNLGITYEALNKPLKAAEYYQKTLALDPKNMLAHFGLGNAFLKSNQAESALLEYKEAINLNPEHIPSYANMGTVQMQLGMFNQGRATFEAILSKKPSIAKIHKYLGIIHSQMKESPDKAIFHLQESLRLAPNQPEAAQIKLMIQTVTKKIA